MKLSSTEEKVMAIIWKMDGAYLKDILEKYPGPTPAPSTIATLLKRMQEKGFVGYEMHGSSRYYLPEVSSKHYFKDYFSELKSKFFEGSPLRMASFFAQETGMTREQLEELRFIIDKELDQDE